MLLEAGALREKPLIKSRGELTKSRRLLRTPSVNFKTAEWKTLQLIQQWKRAIKPRTETADIGIAQVMLAREGANPIARASTSTAQTAANLFASAR